MLNLVGTGEKLQLVTTVAGAIDVLASWADWVDATQTGENPDGASAAITTAAAIDIVAAPAAGKRRNVKLVMVSNVHATLSNTVRLQRVDAGRTVKFPAWTLLPGEVLILNDAGVPFLYDVNGGVKSSSPALALAPSTNEFRLSGVSATPVMTADSTTLSTIYLTSYRGNRIALNDGVNWQVVSPAAEISLAVTGRTTDLPFDVFAFISAGTVALEFLNWTSATARATAVVRDSSGVWIKSGDITRRYLGSCRPRSATTFHWVMGGVDAPVKFDLWNVDNRVAVDYSLRSATATWAYTIATIRQAQASANYQVDLIVGLQEENFAGLLTTNSTNSTISIGRSIGIGYDSTTAYATGCLTSVTVNTVASIMAAQTARLSHQPAIGVHKYTWLEASVATGVTTWTGASATAGFVLQSGMVGEWTC